MTEIIEQRVRPTLIRRRAKKEEELPPPTPEEIKAAETTARSAPEAEGIQAAAVAPVQVVARQLGVAPAPWRPGIMRPGTPPPGDARIGLKPQVPGQQSPKPVGLASPLAPKKATAEFLQTLEDKFKKAPKKKLSKAEMDFDEIQRAGGLKHYVKSDEVEAIIETKVVHRVFEPGPRRRKAIKREFHRTAITQPKASKKVIKVADGITVSELSQNLGIKSSELIKKLMELGVMTTANQTIDVDTATLLAKEYGHDIEHAAFKEEAVFEGAAKKKGSNIVSRSPVVTIMGHVDHGKTSILDYIRKAKVAAGEAGGITQHIGAYEVVTPKGKITFIDTPGHAAFTSMRARGAKVTDLVILVVAAEDGVMPQTKEAIDHAKAAGVPIIVAINKIDKPDADIERVKRALSEYGVVPEEWGGDTICVGTSAKSGVGIDQLLEMVLLQAEVMELKVDTGKAAKGTIIEAKLDRGFGPTATVLVQEGTLNAGSAVICGLHYGRVKTLINSLGQQVKSAGPSEAVSIIGLSGVPLAGDELIEVASERDAKDVSESRTHKTRMAAMAKTAKITLEDLQKQVADGTLEELGVVLKADVHGSIEAIRDALLKLSTEKVKVKVIHAGVGGVTESDVMLAAAGKGLIIGFNVVPETGVASLSEQAGVEIRRYSIIYELLDEVRKSMEGLLAPIQLEKIVGHAEVRQVFTVSKVGVIAGCGVKDGKIPRSASIRLIRDSAVKYTGKIESLKHFKDDAKEVTEGNECGISIGYNDIKKGDVFEAFIIEYIAQKL